MELSFAVSGMGTSGICSQCFSFAVPLAEYPFYSSEFPGGSCVQLSGSGGSTQVFYISSKSDDDVSVKITCYDRMTFTEADFPCTEEEFYDSDGEEIPMRTDTVLSRICSECGFAHYFVNDENLLTAVPTLEKSFLFGRTCHDILSALSEAFCGYWCCSGTLEDLVFVPFGTDISEIAPYQTSSQYHEKLRENSSAMISKVYLTNNETEFGNSPTGIDTVSINTSLASQALYSALNDRIACVYSGIKCGSAYLVSLPRPPMIVEFAGEEYPQYVNYCSAKISSRGILASLGRNKTDEGTWVYKNRTRRELEKRYAEGDIWKNVKITKKGGFSIVYYNANSD